jgi:hypothetical protein
MRTRRQPPVLRRGRRGSAILVVVLLMLAVTGLGLLALRQGQDSVTLGSVSTDAQRALQIADACAAGAVKTLPTMLDAYLMLIREFADDPAQWPPIFHQQLDASFFGDDATRQYGDSPRRADCVVQILDIADDLSAPGYSEGGGCFKRITLLATAGLSRFRPVGGTSSDVLQRDSRTVREVLVRGLFGPVNCF